MVNCARREAFKTMHKIVVTENGSRGCRKALLDTFLIQNNWPLLPLVIRRGSLGQPLEDEPDLPAVVELILHDVEPLPVVVRLLAVAAVAPLVEPVVVADGQLL